MPLITVSCLGQRGRTGNAMFQYAFAKGYAMALNCDLHTPDWWGRKVFPEAAQDPMITTDLPKTHCDSVTHHLKLPLGYFIGKTDIDLNGYFQHQTFLDFYSRRQVREWFKLKPELEAAIQLDRNQSYSAMHLRRGDYASDPVFQKLYCTISKSSYGTAISEHKVPQQVHIVFEGWMNSPKGLTDLNLGWLQDFLFLRDAAYLLRSNSTFAWWAATLGHGKVYSPVVGNKVGLQTVPFVEGNHPNTAGIFPNQSDLFLKE